MSKYVGAYENHQKAWKKALSKTTQGNNYYVTGTLVLSGKPATKINILTVCDGGTVTAARPDLEAQIVRLVKRVNKLTLANTRLQHRVEKYKKRRSRNADQFER